MPAITTPPIIHVDPNLIETHPDNPNVMDADDFAKLKASITKFGFLQPIVVRSAYAQRDNFDDGDIVEKDNAFTTFFTLSGDVGEEAALGGVFEIVDGEHRLRAAKELGMDLVPCVVIHDEPDVVRVLRISMNRLRVMVEDAQ